MEIVGKVIQVLPVQNGTSAKTGKPWALKTFIIEENSNSQFPRRVAIEIFGEDRIANNPVEMDQLVTASIDIESREVNGRWFTSVRAWKVQQGDTTAAAAPAAAAPVAAPAPAVAPAAAAPAANVEVFDPSAADDNSQLPF